MNSLIFGPVNLNDEENRAIIKSVQTFIIKSKRFTPWHAHIIFVHLFYPLNKIAPSGGRREYFWGISCEKSLFYAKKSLFSPIAEGGAKIVGVFRVKNHDFTPL